jgi:hypothetical protein
VESAKTIWLIHGAYRTRKLASKISHCTSCLERNKNCAFIKRDCAKLRKKLIRFCYECADMPCNNLAKIDKHYRARYGMSMIENQRMIENKGMTTFLKREAETYRCQECGDIASVHDGKCYFCGHQGDKPRARTSACVASLTTRALSPNIIYLTSSGIIFM